MITSGDRLYEHHRTFTFNDAIEIATGHKIKKKTNRMLNPKCRIRQKGGAVVYEECSQEKGAYLDLDLVCELLQVTNQLPGLRVRDPEHHLQPRPPSGPPSHPHPKVVLRLELHVSLEDQIRREKNNNSNSDKEAGTRQRRQDRRWF